MSAEVETRREEASGAHGAAALKPVATKADAAARSAGAPFDDVATIRGGGVLRAIERLVARVDALLGRLLPPEENPLNQPGAAANFALATAIVSGVALLLWYSPSVQFAYSSLAALPASRLGGWVRALHRYSSDLAMLFIAVHAFRVVVARKFTGVRWLPWVSGLGLIGLVWFIGWTGYWLVWDQPAQQIALTSMRLLDALPIFGEPMARLYVADRLVPSLLFFVVFFLHMLLPLGIAVGLAVHLVRVNRVRLFPTRAQALALGGGLAVAAWLVPAALDAPAQMALKAPAFTVDAWYLAPLALALRLQSGGVWVAIGLAGAGLLAIPWVGRRRRKPAAAPAFVTESRCHACTQCVQDCPFDAITMVARTDGKRFAARALVDPAKCVACGVCAGACDSEGIALPWFDTRREEGRIEREVAAEISTGGSRWVAFVGADLEGGLGQFSLRRWQTALPGYQVQALPTASWLRPKLVETLLAAGIDGILVVRDGRVEAHARDGNRWVEARLAGQRTPVFRPQRAGGRDAWCVLAADGTDQRRLAEAAAAFRRGHGGHASRGWPRWRTAVAVSALAAGLVIASVAPSHLRVHNPVDPQPEFVFSFKVLGDRLAAAAMDPAAEAAKPVHMRGVATGKAHRAPVRVRVGVDGAWTEHVYEAKGISHDGPALDQLRLPLAAGEREVRVEVFTGPESAALTWSATIAAEPRRLHVLTYEPGAGFRLD